MFQDTFYHSDDGEEGIEEYEYDPTSSEPAYDDPLRPGCAQDTVTILDPRCYFLSVFKVRIGRIHGEWRHLSDTLEEWIKEAVSP